jgi:hypothetical protein
MEEITADVNAAPKGSPLIAPDKASATKYFQNKPEGRSIEFKDAAGVPNSARNGTLEPLLRTGRFSDKGRMDAIFDKIVGEADHPENRRLATLFGSIRQFMDMISLETAGITALATDPVQMVSMMQHMGLGVGESTGLINAAIKNQWSKSSNKEALRSRYLAMGAGLDAWVNAVATRVGGSPGSSRGVIAKGHKFLFRANGLSSITSSFQFAYMDAVEQAFANIVERGFKDMDVDQLHRAVERFGISKADMDKLSGEVITDAMGKKRIMLGNLADADLSRKFRNYLNEGMRSAVLEPNSASTSLAHLGFKAGTWEGEIARTVTQYLSFSMAVYQKTFARLMNGYGEKGLLHNPLNGGLSLGQQHMLVMSVLGIGSAAMGITMKDMFKGREPVLFDPVQFTKPSNMARIVAQAGMFPILDEWLVSGGPSLPVGPTVNLASKAAGIRSKSDVVNFALDSTPLIDTLPLVHEAKKALMATMFQDFYATAWEHRLAWFEEERGGGSFIHPIEL